MHLANAQIEKTMLGVEDHGVFSFILRVDYGGGLMQGIGGYSLDGHDENMNYRPCSTKSIALLRTILEVVGVREWEDLTGKYIRVIQENDYSNSPVLGIQNITTDKKILFKEFWKD